VRFNSFQIGQGTKVVARQGDAVGLSANANVCRLAEAEFVGRPASVVLCAGSFDGASLERLHRADVEKGVKLINSGLPKEGCTNVNT
jgi:hypothetical protein